MTSTGIRLLSKKEFFFKRPKEVDFLKKVIHSPPNGINVLFGGKSCCCGHNSVLEANTGKSTLLSKVLSDELGVYESKRKNTRKYVDEENCERLNTWAKTTQFPWRPDIKPKVAVLSLDLRQSEIQRKQCRRTSFSGRQDLFRKLQARISFYNALLQLAGKAKLKAKLGHLHFTSLFYAANPATAAHAYDIGDLLDRVATPLPISNMKDFAPLFVIDEANKLKDLDRKYAFNRDKNCLRDILDWCKAVSKQSMHVVLGSSDASFYRWLREKVGEDNIRPRVIGDLPYSEAEEYYKACIEMKRLNSLPFDEVYEYFGNSCLLSNRREDVSY
eukprot:TRINITY_DN12066_c0_g1_i1.p1 TRINITY_DN12066_c0_g1~~TRINITY_DN12066_c0_g1_i1.p1  ORF type:complete len:383 (+),score=7.15 TRINITY_DN12066_c0_g1_i1:160-1149(+)